MTQNKLPTGMETILAALKDQCKLVQSGHTWLLFNEHEQFISEISPMEIARLTNHFETKISTQDGRLIIELK